MNENLLQVCVYEETFRNFDTIAITDDFDEACRIAEAECEKRWQGRWFENVKEAESVHS